MVCFAARNPSTPLERTDEGKLCLAPVLDQRSRRLLAHRVDCYRATENAR